VRYADDFGTPTSKLYTDSAAGISGLAEKPLKTVAWASLPGGR
jgi:hypothetical protein